MSSAEALCHVRQWSQTLGIKTWRPAYHEVKKQKVLTLDVELSVTRRDSQPWQADAIPF